MIYTINVNVDIFFNALFLYCIYDPNIKSNNLGEHFVSMATKKVTYLSIESDNEAKLHKMTHSF